MNWPLESPSRPPRVPLAARPATSEPLSPLNESHYRLLREIAAARRPVQKAARTARASAITILVIGSLSIVAAVAYPDWLGGFVVAGVCTVGVVEYAGSRRMARGVPSAAVLLGVNQLAFLSLIAVYCGLRMASFSPAAAQAALSMPELQTSLDQLPEVQADLLRQLDVWTPIIAYGSYSLIIAISLVYQGGLAVYYFTRRRHLVALQRNTPPWVERLFATLKI